MGSNGAGSTSETRASFYPTPDFQKSALEQETVSLRRTFPLFFGSYDRDWLLRRQRRDWWQEEGTIMTAHAGMAPYDLNEEETTHLIPPRPRLGCVDFRVAAIRAVLQSNPAHASELLKNEPS